MKYFTLLYLLFCNFPTESQTILFYCPEERMDILVPTIESQLHSLVYRNSNIPLFGKIINLNRLFDQKDVDYKRREVLHFLNNELQYKKNIRHEHLTNLEAKSIQNSDQFILIKMNKFDGLIEYQLELYRIVLDTINVGDVFPKIDPTVIRTSNFFVHPNRENYKDELLNGGIPPTKHILGS